MTEEELDRLARELLLDSLRLEWDDFLETAPPAETSERHRHQMQTMVADPLAWYRRKTRPVWKKTLRAAASILIICSLSLGTLMAVSPTAHAGVVQWVKELYATHILYRYAGEPTREEMPLYQIAALPEGYEETERVDFPGYVSFTYQNEEGAVFYFDYSFMQQGAALSILTEEMEVLDITVNGCDGQLFLSQDPEQSNAVTWIDEEKNMQFLLNCFANESDILHMAESVILVESTK